jgi:phosphatidylserine/phosphatidylglycerophosphate/cardiolipin synthase-like enzyme
VARASRLAFLVDADAYFSAFAQAVARARESIVVVGWDIQASTRLLPGPMPNGWPPTLREFLDAALEARPRLQAYLLDWDFSLVFALEREMLPMVQLGWLSHPRLHFRLDDEHPLTGCHHQKIVVIDDELAFVGGLDLTTSRWDTPAHRVDDPARRLPNGKPYGPFHDVQIAVAGEAARQLGVLARARWQRATGESLRPPSSANDPWPPGLRPDLVDVDVAIARTEPPHQGRPGVGEVEALYVDTIAAAHRWIYVENQYFTSARIADALAARLAEPDGPEIVMVGPRICSGWLEERSMGATRCRLLHALRTADRHGRFRVYHPRLPGEGCADLNVHAKVMIVDDVLARVGSSNLSNRSMGLDTECDVAVEARDDPRVPAAIAAFRARLVGEHVGATPAEVAAALAETGSLIATIERFADRPRTLVALAENGGDVAAFALGDIAPVDLERPVAHAPFFEWLLPPTLREPIVLATMRGARALVGVVCTSLVWHWLGRGALLAKTPPQLAIAALAVCYVAGALAHVPIAALHTVSVLALGTRRGVLCAIAGASVADAIVFLLGRFVPRRRLARLAGRHLRPVARLLVPGRIRDVAAVRATGTAPFPVVGLVAGATGVPLGRFLVGTLLVTAPCAAAVGLVAWMLGGARALP